MKGKPMFRIRLEGLRLWHHVLDSLTRFQTICSHWLVTDWSINRQLLNRFCQLIVLGVVSIFVACGGGDPMTPDAGAAAPRADGVQPQTAQAGVAALAMLASSARSDPATVEAQSIIRAAAPRQRSALAGLAPVLGTGTASETLDTGADGKSDLLWYNALVGQTASWLMNGLTATETAVLLSHPSFRVIAAPDFNGDGKSDLLWYDPETGQTVTWLMSGSSIVGSALLLTHPDFHVVATPDFNGDGKADLVWYNAATGQTVVWLMDGTAIIGGKLLLTHPNFQVVGSPDLNGDGKSDLLWYDASTGQTVAWLMDGTSVTGGALLLTHPTAKVVATPDLNGDGKSDLLWFDAARGQTFAWLMNGTTVADSAVLLTHPGFRVVATPDLNGDGKADLLWFDAGAGKTVAWLMNGTTITASAELLTHPSFQVVNTLDLNGDGKSDLIWYDAPTGQTVAWLMNGLSVASGGPLLTDANFKLATLLPISPRPAAPVARAGLDQTVALAAGAVTLDAGASLAVGTANLSYSWSLVVPPGSASTLTGANTAKPTFTPDVAGTYLAQLVVNSGNAVSHASTAKVIAYVTQNLGPSLVTVDGTRLMVRERNRDGSLAAASAYTIRGVNWSPASVGTNVSPTSANGPDIRRPEIAKWAPIDIPLMKTMNVNTVRLYMDPGFDSIQGPKGIAVLDALYEAGIKVIMNIDDSSNVTSRINPAVNYYKNHPAILMWMLGNEWNVNLYYDKVATQADAATLTQAAAISVKAIDLNHPVGSSLGNLNLYLGPDYPGSAGQIINSTCSAVDVWGINLYPGINTFGSTFLAWKAITDKPMFVAEFGADAFNIAATPQGAVDEEIQSAWTKSLWDNLHYNLSSNKSGGVSIGGLVFEWNDEWWKIAGGSPSNHDQGGFPQPGQPDGFFNEEYFGIFSIERTPRKVYAALRIAFASQYLPPSQTVTLTAKSSGTTAGLAFEYGHAQFYYGNLSTRIYDKSGGGGGGRGFNIAALSSNDLTLIRPLKNFDTWGNWTVAWPEMTAFIDELPNGTVLLIAVADDAGRSNCNGGTNPSPEEAGIKALEALGSTHIREYCFRDSWAMATVKGEGKARSEAISKTAEVTVSMDVTLP
jgi:hypothetical protein